MAKASSSRGSGSSGKTVLQTSSPAKAGLNPGNTGVPVFDDKLLKSVTPVPYSGQRGY
jgi:hypothetical protein